MTARLSFRPVAISSARDMLDSCPDLQAVVKSSIGIETVDVDAATDLGIICCNSPTPENYWVWPKRPSVSWSRCSNG